ncbi:MAG: hypothetical protein ABIU54_01860 [Candidatus Eisenbacteria bacterium]
MTTAMGEAMTANASGMCTAQAWRYDPWKERPRLALLASIVAIGLCLMVLAMREHPLLSFGLCLFCVAAFSPAITPVDCRLDDQGVARRALWSWEHRAWNRIQRVVDLPSGVFVSPYPRRHWLDAQRGLSLPMPASERDRLAAEIRRRIGRDAA